ncbi:hypothetical protein NQ314_002006 [Rhamnusium bicolor]|uniref:Uncharacterized protein n=1 Tax=Rhamnusium bicolor TaxID=1586634 RepID=A0AAV8ZQJ0_9CUCU|nr:hypothetical protein NQ314_002006 [Rhamnusium bicolor]
MLDKAQKTFAVLTPVIDFEKQLEKKNVLVKNVNARGLPIDIDTIEKRWKFFQSVTDQKKVLELTRIEIGRLITELMKDADKNKDEIDKLRLHSRLVKDDLKNVKDSYYELEEGTMLQVLSLPNILHEKNTSRKGYPAQFFRTIKRKIKKPHGSWRKKRIY